MAKYRRNREKSREIGQFLLKFNKAQNKKRSHKITALKMQYIFRIFFFQFIFWKKNIKYLFFLEKLMHKNPIKLKIFGVGGKYLPKGG